MFTGIIESTGIVKDVISNGSNKTFWIGSSVSDQLKTDQSVSHNGACLTVEEVKEGLHRVTAVDETLQKTNLGNWEPGTIVNLERCLAMNGRLDGHFVQGHVDATGTCLNIKEKQGSWEYEFGFKEKFAPLLVEKGSVTLNGISLTVFDVKRKKFRVAIIPYTYEHTNINALKAGDAVNLEFDLIGKYILRNIKQYK